MLVGCQAAGVLASIVVARSVGPTGRGVVVTLTVWGQIIGWLAALSLDKALVVLSVGDDAVTSPDAGLRAVRVPLLATSAMAVIGSVFLGSLLFTSPWLTAGLAALAVATAQGEMVAGWLLASSRRPMFIVWRLLQPTIYVLLMIAAALLLRGASTTDRTIVMGLGAAASMVVPVVFVARALPRRPLLILDGIRPLLRFGAAAHVANILQYLNGRLDLLVLTFLVTRQDLGFYAAGAALGQLTLLMASAGFIRGMTKQTDATDPVGIGIAILIAVVVIVAAPVVVPAVFGTAFQPAVPIARVLAIGGVINYALQAACGRLLGRRRPWSVAIAQGVGVVAFAVGIAVYPTLMGAAWSSVASFAVSVTVAQVALRLHPRAAGRQLR